MGADIFIIEKDWKNNKEEKTFIKRINE